VALQLTLDTDDLGALRTRPAAIPMADAIIDLTGPGALTCLQGILTNDVVKTGPEALLWGAVLTPKGMIISDCWVQRLGTDARLIVPPEGRDALQLLLTRSFPPRLAKATARPELQVAWITGGVPEGKDGVTIMVPSGPAPFTAIAIGPTESMMATLAAAGFPAAPTETADALRLLGGWPTLGREINDKTLPQEVRFDELEGVRYDKGCYVGQETVARLHFRGHANRTLRGVRGLPRPPQGRRGEGEIDEGGLPADGAITMDGEQGEKGEVTTLGQLPNGWIGIGKIRREVETGAVVLVGGCPGEVVELPVPPRG
jgi:folate-binding protein YgfZ